MLSFHRAVVTFSFLVLTSSVALAQENSQPDFALRTIKTAQNNSEIDSQQPSKVTEPSDPNRVAAEKAEAEARELHKQNVPLLTKISKWKESLKYWRLAGDRKKQVRSLVPIVGLYSVRGEYPKALEYAQQALPIFGTLEALDDRRLQGVLFQFLSSIYKSLGEYQKAIDIEINLQKDIPLLFPDNPKLIPGFLTNIGDTYKLNLGETQKAFEYYNQALAFWQEKNGLVEQAEILQLIAFSQLSSGEITASIETIKKANTLDPDFKRDNKIMDPLNTVLTISSCSNKLASLIKPSTLNQSQTLSNQSKTANSSEEATKNNRNFIENFEQEAEKYRTQGSLQGEAGSLELIGLAYKSTSEYPKALEAFRQNLKLTQLMGAKPNEAETLTRIADILNLQGKKQEAINYLNQALEIQRQLKARPQEANTLFTIGNVYSSLGAYPQSLEAYNQALSLIQVIGDRRSETNTLRRIGAIYQKLQNYQQALNYYQQAVDISKTAGDCQFEAFALEHISRGYFASGDYKQALRMGNEALTLSRNLVTNEVQLGLDSKILQTLAQVENKQGNYSKSLELSEKARKLAQDSGHKDIEANSLTVTAEAYEALKQPEKAIQTYQEQLTFYRQISLFPEQASSLYNIAKLQRQNNQLPDALQHINEAIKIIENIRKEVASPELRTSFFASKQDYYELKISILMEMHQQDPRKGFDAQAFETSERARARTLLELLNEANADIRNGVDPVLLEQSKTLQYKLAALDKRWSELINGKFTPEQKTAFEKDRKQLLEQYQDIEAQIRAKSPKYAALTQPQPLTLSQIQQQVLDSDTVLLQYSLGEERSYLWVVTKAGLNSYQLPPKKDIEPIARELRDAILYDKNKPDIIAQASAKLSQVIFAPAAEKLTQKRLVIVADGILNYIPFSALSLVNTPLITQYEIANLPSSSSIAILRQEIKNRKPAPKALAILADPIFSPDDKRIKSRKSNSSQQNNPDLGLIALNNSVRALRDNNTLPRLPGTRTEAQAILSLIPESQRISAFDSQANIVFASSPQMSQYRLVHFATHGIFNSESPELSGVILSLVDSNGNSVNGFLRLNEIFNLNLPAELIVLSACETGLGQDIKGEGIVGLTRGFMYAGSPRVIVSLWSVADDATSFLMSRFYHYLLQEKLTPAAALRAAQLEIQTQTEQPNWHSPFYWAAFTLQGEWR